TSQQQVLLKHLRELPDLSKLPVDSRQAVGSLLEKDPKRRPASARVLALELATKAEVAVEPARKRHWASVKRVALGLSGVGLCLIGTGAALAATGNADRIPFMSSGTPEPISTRVFPTPTPTIAAAVNPAPPEIAELSVTPEVALAGQQVAVSMRIHDVNGDVTGITIKGVSGEAKWFGGDPHLELLKSSPRQQLLGTAVFVMMFNCDDDGYKTTIQFEAVDLAGAKSVPALAAFTCQGKAGVHP
ncbi:MAG: hypothetical protein ABI782_13215, partial [Anaerolineaceae bacterium]